MFGGDIVRVSKAKNGFTVSVMKPKTGKSKKDEMEFVEPEEFVFTDIKKVMSFIEDALDAHGEMSDDDIFGKEFKKAVKEDK